jgi:hypothetical protein
MLIRKNQPDPDHRDDADGKRRNLSTSEFKTVDQQLIETWADRGGQKLCGLVLICRVGSEKCCEAHQRKAVAS